MRALTDAGLVITELWPQRQFREDIQPVGTATAATALVTPGKLTASICTGAAGGRGTLEEPRDVKT